MKKNNCHHQTTEPKPDNCRHCGAALQEDGKESRLCDECCWFAADYRRYDALREEGYMSHQAKLMCGLADPPDPDNE